MIGESDNFVLVSEPKQVIHMTADHWTAYLQAQFKPPNQDTSRQLHVLFCTSRPPNIESFLDDLISVPNQDQLQVK